MAKATAWQTSFAGRIRNYFLTGLVVAGPLAITVWLVWSIVTWVDDLVRPLIPPAYRPESYMPWPIPGTGLIIAPVFVQRLRAMGIRDRPIAFRSPWQNAYVERLIGSIRRECLDHMIVFGEAPPAPDSRRICRLL